jgi:hypothetical protein
MSIPKEVSVKTVALLLLAGILSLPLIGETQQALKPPAILQSFLMTVAEDGKEQTDWFELWEVSGEFNGAKPFCSIQVASFSADAVTRVNLWNHTSQRVTEIRPNVFKVEMNGRVNPSGGLEVIVEFNRDRTRIVEMNGSMRSGSRGQSAVVFHVDRKSETRRLPPLRNPSWSLENR